MVALGLGVGVPYVRQVISTSPPPPPPPPGSFDGLLLVNGTDKLLLADGVSYLKLASSP